MKAIHMAEKRRALWVKVLKGAVVPDAKNNSSAKTAIKLALSHGIFMKNFRRSMNKSMR